ncbi:hypothetical protein ACL9RL_04940 [Plantibacter sp. Mn2098]|uniref:hypothetical protein n=1 Tax=Plantibacter sp. Mn2098 TaxID=3395266 RepID=UPI003BE330A5
MSRSVEMVICPESREVAYRVPFIVERDDAPRYRLRNVGVEPVHWVRARLFGPGLMTPVGPCTVPVGSALELHVVGAALERRTSVQVSWFRPDGGQYLLRVTF